MSNKKKTPEKNRNESLAKKLMIANIAVLMAVFAAITLFMTFGKRPNVSYTENRDLEKPPVFTWEDYWAGKVTDQFAKYYNDTVPMRSTWKLFISNFRDHLGIKYKGGITIVGDWSVIEEEQSKPSESTSSKPNNVPDVVIPGTGGSSSSSGNKVPDVYIPPKSSSGADDTHEPTSENSGAETSD